jgi:hypothetical protein
MSKIDELTIGNFKKQKHGLEQNILSDISKRLEDFRTKNGFSPYQIDVDLVETTNLGQLPDRDYVISSIKAKFEIY